MNRMNLGLGLGAGRSEIQLDPERYASKPNGLAIAQVVAAATERERQRIRTTETPIRGGGGGLLGQIGDDYFISDTTPWFELLTRPEVIDESAAALGLHRVELLSVIIKTLMPDNWQTFFWMKAYFESVPVEAHRAAIASAALIERQRLEQETSQRGRNAADAKHNKPGGSRDKRGQIQEIWAGGKYADRGVCAEEEWQALGFGSIDTARKALRNTPNPSPWPGMKAKKTA